MKHLILRSLLLLFLCWVLLALIQDAEADEWYAILKYEACYQESCIKVELRSDPSDYMSCVVHGEMIAMNDLHKNRGKLNHVVTKWSCEIAKPSLEL